MPEVPALPGTPGLVSAVEAAFADGGVLAQAVEQFEPRAGQRAMALAVAQIFGDGGVLLAGYFDARWELDEVASWAA